MTLILNAKRVRNYVIVSSANNDSAVPKQRGAENDYIIPIVGQELFDTLETEAATDPADPSPLLDLAMNALAFLMYFKALPLIHAQITDMGIVNTATEKQTVVYRYQYENLREVLEEEGLAALERLLSFLIEHQEDFPEWTGSEVYERLNSNLIKTGTDFNSLFHIYNPHRTFYTIQPLIQEVEDQYLVAKLGAAFFEELRDAVTLDDNQTYVIKLLRQAEANLAIFKASIKLSVKVSAEGFTVMLSRNPDRADQGEENAPPAQLRNLQQQCEVDGNAYLKTAMNFIQANASNTVFATFFNSPLYKDPTIKKDDANDKMTGVFSM